MIRTARALACLSILLALNALSATPAPERRVDFNIAAQPMAKALNAFATQAEVRIVFYPSTVEGLMAPQVAGALTPQDALKALLANSNLKYRFTDERTVSVSTSTPAAEEVTRASMPEKGTTLMRLAQTTPNEKLQRAEAGQAEDAASKEESKGVPEIMVRGRRSVNTDIVRTEDDVQPYVVFDSHDIERSLSQNLEDFLKRQLPMNTAFGTNSQQGELQGNISAINLRGLGPDETLILVNGRRRPGVSQVTTSGDVGQPDINGIPLAAIERIEVLPSTASGIYGGGATGGVINIILKSDFNQVQVDTTYDNSFDTDSGARRIDLTAGFSFEQGRTNILLNGSYSDSNEMLIGDRDFVRKARALYFANVAPSNDSFFLPLSATTNIRGLDDFTNGGYYELALNDPNGGAPIPLGSSITYVPYNYAGVQSDGGAGLIANAGNLNHDLPRDIQGLQAGILNAPVVTSFGANLRRQFSSRIEAFMDLSWSRNEGRIGEAVDFTQFFLCPGPGSEPNLDWCAGVDENGDDVFLFSAGNPFAVPVEVTFPTPGLSFEKVVTSDSAVANGGFIVRLPGSWTAQAEYSWSRSRAKTLETSPFVTDQGTAAVDSGAVNVFRDVNVFVPDYLANGFSAAEPTSIMGPLDNTHTGATLRLAGPLYQLPGGPLRVALFGEHRKADVALGVWQLAAGTNYYLPRMEKVDSASLETYVPLFSKQNRRRGLHALELQASVRYDSYYLFGPETGAVAKLIDGEYVIQNPRFSPRDPITYRPVNFSSVEANSTDYTMGLRYAPSEDLAVRASFGTGFRPPTVAQTTASESLARISNLIDPKRQPPPPAPQTRREPQFSYTLVTGGGPQLRPEESESLSLGMIFTPRFLKGLRLSVDFTDIEKDGEIASMQAVYNNLQALLAHENDFPDDDTPGHITRAPLTDADRLAGYQAGKITRVDFRLFNASRTSVRSFDMQADYTFDTRMGQFRAYALGTYLKDYIFRFIESAGPVESAGTVSRLQWRGNGGVTWQRNAWSLDWNVQYYGSYRLAVPADVIAQGSPTIPRQMYHDLSAKVALGEALGMNRGILADTELLLGLKNVFNTSPPIVATVEPTVGYSWFGDPRLRRYSVSLRKSFR